MTYEPVPDFPGLSVRLAPNADGRVVVTGLKIEADAVTSEMLRKVPMSRIEQDANLGRSPVADLPPLRRTPDMTPEAFARLVADHYRAWARTTSNPGAALAAQWGVKAPTMHTWIREARLRGFLPPARRRKG